MFEKGHGRRERQSGRGRGGRRESPAGSRPPYYYPLFSRGRRVAGDEIFTFDRLRWSR